MADIADFEGRTWEDDTWPTADIIQYGPDGTTQLGVLRFWVCPSCGDHMSGPNDDPDLWRRVHRGYHEDVRTLLELVGDLQRRLEGVERRNQVIGGEQP